MTIPRLLGMRRYWEHTPPVHISLARLCTAYLTMEKPKKPADKGNLGDLIAACQQAGMAVT